MVETPTAPLYVDGQWSTVTDEFRLAFVHDPMADNAEVLRDLGFRAWTRIGDEQALDVPLSLEVLHRHEGAPHWLVFVEGDAHGDILHAYAQALPDVMGLLSQWVPTVQGATVTEMLRQLNSVHETERPFLEGLSQVLNR